MRDPRHCFRAAAPLLALLLADAAAAVPPPPCRTHPEVVGRCRWVHGRYSIWNGTPSQRIWVVGTRRILGISEWPSRAGEGLDGLPANMRAAIGDDPSVVEAFGDFEVCPFSRQRPGVMQYVCVARAHRLHVRRR